MVHMFKISKRKNGSWGKEERGKKRVFFKISGKHEPTIQKKLSSDFVLIEQMFMCS